MHEGKREKVLAIVPARGASKRVPKKNIRLLAGKPLLAYTIQAALNAKGIDRLIVSTEDPEIAAVAKEYGAEVPFLRPVELARDTTPDQPVFEHALDRLQQHGYLPDIVLNLRPTTPFKTASVIDEVIDRIAGRDEVEVVRTMSPVTGIHHPFWMYTIRESGYVTPFAGVKVSNYYQSQLLPPVYRINSVADAMRTRIVRANAFLDSEKMVAVIVPEFVAIDIDTELDFEICESLIGRIPVS